MKSTYFVVTPNSQLPSVPPGEALIWSILSDLSQGPVVFKNGGSGVPVGSLDVRLYEGFREFAEKRRG